MPVKRLIDYLDRNLVQYETIEHSTAFTAQGIAALTHTPGSQFAKAIVVKLNGVFAMAVVPASYHVDLRKLKEETGATTIALASEMEFRALFPECETGAMPPFGNLYGMPVYVDESLTHLTTATFNAGSHREMIRMAWRDYEVLVQPTAVSISTHAAGAHAA